MNWKFWTWPKQIRMLKAQLRSSDEVIVRQRMDLERLTAALATARQRAGKH